ncbi:MAG: translocation/assembly module TamB domain-containing protein [Rhodobacter sp.]|nr:translocation/assembly module TamB domain-containing protein [Paracoccaceae bacterium]MCC0075573.1 translocation/assembly module TamB domain-containing protein [Rhodobacter sp.]
MGPNAGQFVRGAQGVRTPFRWRWAAWGALFLALTLAIAAPALSSVEEDEGILVSVLQDFLSDAGREVRIRGFEGALSSRATVREISIADDDGVWITLTDVVIDWNRTALLERRIDVNELSAGTITLARFPTTQTDNALPESTAREGFSLPELPVSVHIGEVRADRVRIDAAVTGQAAEVVLVGSAQLAGGQGHTRFDAHRIDGQEGSFLFEGDFDNASRVLSLDLSLGEGSDGIATTLLGIPGAPALGLTIRGHGPIATFDAAIALSTDDQQRVTGNVALIDETPETGVLEGGGFNVTLDGDLRPLISSELHPFFGAESRLRAFGQRNENGEIDLSELSIVTGAMQMAGRALLGSSGFPRVVVLTAGIARDDGQPVLLPGTSGAARINQATLTIDHDAEVSRDWSLRAEIEGLDLGTTTIANAVLDGRGRLNAVGAEPATGDAPEVPFEGVFEFSAQGIAADDPALQQAVGDEFYGLASLVWPGPDQAINLTGLAFEGNTVSLTAYGDIDGLTFDGFVDLEAPDLSAFSGLAGRPLGGRALATLQGQLNPATGAMDFNADLTTRDLTVDVPEADALLAGEAGIAVSLKRDTEGTTLRQFDLTAGTVEMSASGLLRPGLVDLRAQLMAHDLTQLGEGYGGRLALDVLLGIDDSGQRLRFDGSAIDLQLADLPGAGALDGFLQGANRVQGDFLQQETQTEVRLLSIEGPRLELNGSGIWSATNPDLALTLHRLDLSGLGAGGRGEMTGSVRLTGENGHPYAELHLSGDGPLRVGVEAIDGVLGSGLSLTGAGGIEADGALRVDTLDLQAGGLNLTARGRQGADGATRVQLEGAVDSMGRIVPGISGPARLSADLSHRAGVPGYGLNATLTGPSGLTLTAEGSVAEDFTLDLALQGQVEGTIINPVIEPSNVTGLIRFSGTMQGPPGLDALRLDARASGGRYVLPVANVAFQGIEAQAHLDGLVARVQLDGESLSGGRGHIEGTITLDDRFAADLDLRVTDLQIQQPRLFTARLNGEATLTGPMSQAATVRGAIDVSEAEILIPNSPLARQGFRLVGLSHVGEDADSRRTREAAGIATGTSYGREPRPLRLDLSLNAPGRIFVRGRGLDAELGGTLRLGGTTHDVVPAGSFGLIRGRLDLLGNRFTLTDGSASMVGSFMPVVSLTATTESDGVQTSVTLAGHANSPEITFSSVPELPQDEVLARLVFRRSLASLSPFQAAQLALSLATLTGRAENSILSRTRQAMGLDDLDFTVDEAGNTALRFGRYINDRVYTDVSVDSTGRGEVSINLDLTPNIRLRGRTDTDGTSGVGVFFERDY